MPKLKRLAAENHHYSLREGTKIICSGNLAQIDSPYLTPVTSGLTYIVERFKNFEGSVNLYLNGVVRSRLASFAEENL
ncbi:hypothetical protein PCI56_20410 [Plesiomonas shigelloides subsp. oncorhynchi]|nr:hypothetical protein [Plesiomonas shigelloides]